LEKDDEDHDIYIVEETGKFVIKDLEEEENKKKSLKRTRLQASHGHNEDVEMAGESSDEDEVDNNALKKRMQGATKK
jgi:hypothetical protein